MPTKCVPKMHCGALSPGWLNGKHPTVGEGVAERMICFTKDDDCCYWYSKVLVRNCSDFIVYSTTFLQSALLRGWKSRSDILNKQGIRNDIKPVMGKRSEMVTLAN